MKKRRPRPGRRRIHERAGGVGGAVVDGEDFDGDGLGEEGAEGGFDGGGFVAGGNDDGDTGYNFPTLLRKTALRTRMGYPGILEEVGDAGEMALGSDGALGPDNEDELANGIRDEIEPLHGSGVTGWGFRCKVGQARGKAGAGEEDGAGDGEREERGGETDAEVGGVGDASDQPWGECVAEGMDDEEVDGDGGGADGRGDGIHDSGVERAGVEEQAKLREVGGGQKARRTEEDDDCERNGEEGAPRGEEIEGTMIPAEP